MRWDVARELDRTHGLPRLSVFETLHRTDTSRDIERGRGAALADAIHGLLKNPPERAETRRHAEQFSWDETTRGQLALFERVVGSISRPGSAPPISHG